jgi:hypothetical protein
MKEFKKCFLCESKVICKGYCIKHYHRLLKYGDPNKILIREAGQGTINGKNKSGYICVKVKGKSYLLHRLVMEKHLKRKLLATEIVHHINENQLDNRIENLEVMTRAEHIRLHHCGKKRPKK